MRPRKWVLIVAFLCLIITVALYLGKRSLEKRRELENLLIQSISPFIQGTIDVKKIRLGFLSAHLYGITLNLPLKSSAIYIEHVKIGFSFGRMINFKGDYSRAINKIIFQKPELYLTLDSANTYQDHQSVPQQQGVKPPTVAVPEQLPVPFIIVKDGRIWFSDWRRDTILIGEHLNGTMTNKNIVTEVNLSGKSGSLQNNLDVKGAISWNGGMHSLSINLKQAAVKKPITLKDAVIVSGSVNGNLSFVFPDTLSLKHILSYGVITIEKGQIVLKQLPSSLEDVSLDLRADGSKWSIDTLSGYYRQSTIKISGVCNLIDTPYLYFDFIIDTINPNSISTLLPAEFTSVVSGDGRITGQIQKSSADVPVHTQFRGEGFTIGKFKNSRFIGACTFTDSSQVTIDSLSVTDGNAALLIGGAIRTNSVPAYELSVNGLVDSLHLDEKIAGAFRLQGTVTGTSHDPQFSLQVEGQHVSVMNHTVGNLSLSSNGNNRNVTISLHPSANFSGTLDIEKPFSENPDAKLLLNVGTAPINSILKRKSGIPELDTATMEISAHGWIDAFSATVSVVVGTKDVQASIDGNIKKKSGFDSMTWTLQQRMFKVRGITTDFAAKGVLYNDSLVIDSLVMLEGVTAHGRLFFTMQPVGIEAECEFNVPVPKLLEIVPGTANIQVTGTVFGRARFSGVIDQPYIRSEIHVRELGGSGINNLHTDAILTHNSGITKIYPMVIRNNLGIIASFDTVTVDDSAFSFSGEFENIDLHSVFGTVVPREVKVDSRLSGTVSSSKTGFPVIVHSKTPSLRVNKWKFDSVSVTASLNRNGLTVTDLRTQDENLHVNVAGFVPWSVFYTYQKENDTLYARVDARGDLLKYIETNFKSPIGGTGKGNARIAFYSVPGAIKVTEGMVEIPQGVLSLQPYVLSDIKNFTFLMTIDSTANVHTSLSGMVKRRPISIQSTHAIPDGFEPFTVGPFDFGVLQVKTPERGIDIHLPGFMQVGEVGDIEFQGKDPFNSFTLSGPVGRLRITGTWVLRNLEFTFPFLNTNEAPWEFDLFPYITWDFDLKPGDRRMMYFWDLYGKRRRILRFFEGYLDPTSIVKVRGRDLDSDFRLYGLIRSYKGAVYYGKMFDRNLNVGVEFEPQKHKDKRGFDNLPVIWGSAEALGNSKRLNRTKITCIVHDPQTKALSERGRLVEGRKLNITFQVSSDFEEQSGEGEREFFKQAGLTFSTLGGAGEMVSDFGEHYFHRYLLERWERKLAKRFGFDVINIESSITSNYFYKLYSRQFERLVDRDDYLAFANLGITVGRYFFRDYLFLKARGELIPVGTTLLRPEYSVGLELQPNHFLLMDFNYGVHKGETGMKHDPRVALQLTLPVTRLRTLLKF